MAKDTGGDGGLTVSGLNTMYQSQLTAYLAAKGINTKEQSYVDRETGAVVYGDGKGFIKESAFHAKTFNTSFIDTIQKPDGSFGPAASTLIGSNVSLQSIASGMSAADGATTDASLSTGDAPEVPTIDWKQKSAVVADPAGFTDHIYEQRPDVSFQKLFDTLLSSGVSLEIAQQQSLRVKGLQEAAKKAAANAPRLDENGEIVYGTGDTSNFRRKRRRSSNHNPDGTPK